MLERLKQDIELNQGSKKIYWRVLKICKDLIWQINNVNVMLWSALSKNIAIEYITSWIDSHRKKKIFRDVKTYCMFIGYPRSGHSIIGSLLDAHPNIAISYEVDALRYFLWRFDKYQVFSIILKSISRFKRTEKHAGYSYVVPNQWQGRFKKLIVIGDKRCGKSSIRLSKRPWLINRLSEQIKGIDVRIIHMIRNPYDNIASIVNLEDKNTIDSAIEEYFLRVRGVDKIRKMHGKIIMDIYQDEFVINPKKTLRELCLFLGVKPTKDYIDACSKIVWKNTRKTRSSIDWSYNQKRRVDKMIKRIDFLRKFRFDY